MPLVLIRLYVMYGEICANVFVKHFCNMTVTIKPSEPDKMIFVFFT